MRPTLAEGAVNATSRPTGSALGIEESRSRIRGMSEDQATVAEEEYLQIIYWLQEGGLPMTGANIARAMQVSAPLVPDMIGRREGAGCGTRPAAKSVGFRKNGREHAAQIVGRHGLSERFLTGVFD